MSSSAPHPSFKAFLGSLACTLFLGTPLALADVGNEAPEITGKLLQGGRFKLSNLRDKPVVLNFFWVNCIPCRTELPELAAMEKENPAVRFIAVHVEDDPDEAVAEFIQKLPAAPKTVVLAKHRTQTNYGTKSLPETHLLDQTGVIVQTLNGYSATTIQALKDWLRKQKSANR